MREPRSSPYDVHGWVGLLAAVSAVATLALACATPFSALAAVAATRMPARASFALVALAWGSSQAVGFGVLGYPGDVATIAWGFAILTAAVAGVAAARWAAHAVKGGTMLRLAAAFAAGFVAYKGVLIAWSFGLGGVHVAVSPYWTARQLVSEGAFLLGLLTFYNVAVMAGMPRIDRATRSG